ncbi:MAG: competence/damage-inducible protein A [Flavobacteriaceae bacterium]|nr:competence/damage-inducible protein A [Flavobacteriaceae bacterium]
MKAEIITIGDEILIGQIVDSNSAFLGKQLNKIGIDVFQITSVQDDEKHIINALKDASKRADLVITTGGLGPTKDDLTKKTLCSYFSDELVLDQQVLEHIEEIFRKYVSTPILPANKTQAYLPSKSTGLFNRYGTAPGMWIEQDQTVYISLPGVPYEMKSLMRDEVIPRLKERFKTPYIIHKTILTYGLGESAIADRIEEWEDALPQHIKLAYLPNFGRVRLRLTTRGVNEDKLYAELNEQINKLHTYIGDIIKGFEDEESLEENIARLFVENGLSLSTAESCTGGKIASKFSDIPGASGFLKGGIVSYATSAKSDALGISDDIIETHSVVSKVITSEMANKSLQMFNSDLAIATTGNAGPTKGDSDAAIGTVFIALADGKETKVHQFNFGNQRERVTNKAVNKSFELIYDWIIKQNKQQN